MLINSDVLIDSNLFTCFFLFYTLYYICKLICQIVIVDCLHMQGTYMRVCRINFRKKSYYVYMLCQRCLYFINKHDLLYVLFVLFFTGFTFEYTRTSSYTGRNGDVKETWGCCLCRHIRNKRANPKPPLSTIKLENGHLRTNPDGPPIPHICLEEMKSTANVVARNFKKKFLTEMKESGTRTEPPKHAHERLLKEAVQNISIFEEEVCIYYELLYVLK